MSENALGKVQDRGHIDGFLGDAIYGWFVMPQGVRAGLRIDRRTLVHLQANVQRPDVRIALDLNSDVVGFDAYVPADLFDGEKKLVELLAIRSDSITVIMTVELDFQEKLRSQASSSSQIGTLRNERRAAVVCWDLAHNPAGRAMVLYDILAQEYDAVDLVGPMFSRFGRELWSPLKTMNLNVVTQSVESYADLIRFCRTAAEKKYEFVWVCKPRLPSLLIALSIAESSKCKMALDIDDYEMSFFGDKIGRPMAKQALLSLARDEVHPADFDATALAHSYIDKFHLQTVSNKVLQETFGGEIVPHARSLETFRPNAYSKWSKRAELGISKNEQVVAFVGTIRKHKGILSVAEAVGRLEEEVVLLVAGSYESEEIKEQIKALAKGRVKIIGLVPFEELPDLLVAADAICLPQDVDSETSAYQLPAKLIDGLALGLKVLVNDLPAYEDLKELSGLFIRGDEEAMDVAIRRMLQSEIDPVQAREEFEQRLSTEAMAIKVSSYFSTVRADECLSSLSDVSEAILGRPLDTGKPKFSSRPRSERLGDLVVLWKQVDSGLFGRRVDMISKYLLAARSFERVIVLDAPISSWDYAQLQARAAFPGLTNARLLHDGIARKFLTEYDESGIIRKSFITSEVGERILGRQLPRRDELAREIGSFLEEIHVANNSTLLIYPVAPHLADILRTFKFRRTIVDLVDDEREFAKNPVVMEAKHDAYVHSLGVADFVITNNHTMRNRFQGLSGRPIHVIENGVEEFDSSRAIRLEGIPLGKKIIGYVGNLRDRVDISLILGVAERVENAHVLLVGPTGGNRDIERLRFHPNISMTGALSYELSREVAAGFDVALIPHTLDALSDSMNPLKFYLYKQLGLPIVTTPVKNLGSFEGLVYCSDGSVESFIENVNKAIQKGRSSRHIWRRRGKFDLWPSRVQQIRRICGV